MRNRLVRNCLLLVVLAAPAPAFSQERNPQVVLQAQREAMASLRFLDGVWRGPAWTLQPNGEKRNITQTERIGVFLQGTVRVIEGRGYKDDGEVGFNALGIVSYDATKKTFALRSYALGYVGDFPFIVNPDGYVWEVPAGPNAKIHYTATVRDNTLHEVGDRIVEGQPPLRVFEMTLKRVGDTSWPAGDAVPRN